MSDSTAGDGTWSDESEWQLGDDALSGPEGEIPAVALTIRRSDGAVDFVYSSGDEIERSWDGGTAAGRFVHARVKGGKAQSLAMIGARGLRAFGVSVKPEEAPVPAKPAEPEKEEVKSVSAKGDQVYTSNYTLPAGAKIPEGVNESTLTMRHQ